LGLEPAAFRSQNRAALQSCFCVIVVSKPEQIAIDRIYVPVKRRKALDAEAVKRIAESILDVGQEMPISVRPDEDQHRYVLLDGLHRLEACKALGETTISALVGSAGEPADERPPYEVAAEMQRQTMERLRKLRLEQEAARKTEAASPSLNSAQRAGSRTKTKKSDSKPKSLSDWIDGQERSGGRY
jgi:ParB/RepB/Spo0J family partition protein